MSSLTRTRITVVYLGANCDDRFMASFWWLLMLLTEAVIALTRWLLSQPLLAITGQAEV